MNIIYSSDSRPDLTSLVDPVGWVSCVELDAASANKELDVLELERRIIASESVLAGSHEEEETNTGHVSNSAKAFVDRGRQDVSGANRGFNDLDRNRFDATRRRVFLSVGAELAGEPEVDITVSV